MNQNRFHRQFPATRMRRLRHTQWMLNMLQENHLTSADLILPLFVHDNQHNVGIDAMPGIERHSINSLLKQVECAVNLHIPAIALFPAIDESLKNEEGSEAWNENNLVCRAITAIKKEFPDIGVIADIALDPYTDHGQDGIMVDGYIANDLSLKALKKQARVQVDAGCDILAPSDMMDGRIKVIRDDMEQLSQHNMHIMSYAAKYNSAFYGPFRDAVGAGSKSNGNRKAGGKSSYQINPANAGEAMNEIALDIAEGADSIIVKPGMPYLDIIRQVKDRFAIPVFAYQVSGEYSMIQAAANNRMLDLQQTMLESLLAFKRAGATGIWTYFALEAAQIINSAGSK